MIGEGVYRLCPRCLINLFSMFRERGGGIGLEALVPRRREQICSGQSAPVARYRGRSSPREECGRAKMAGITFPEEGPDASKRSGLGARSPERPEVGGIVTVIPTLFPFHWGVTE